MEGRDSIKIVLAKEKGKPDSKYSLLIGSLAEMEASQKENDMEIIEYEVYGAFNVAELVEFIEN